LIRIFETQIQDHVPSPPLEKDHVKLT